jgi:beta-lactamase class A
MALSYKVLIMSLLSTVSMAQKADLKSKIEAYIQTLPQGYEVSMKVENLKGKVFYDKDSEKKVPSASTIKIPIMMVLMEDVKANLLDLAEIHTLKSTEKVEGGSVYTLPDDSKLTLLQLMEAMIISSDNSATNIFIKRLGKEKINEKIRNWGFEKTILNRIMLDFEAAKQGRENLITCAEVNQMLRMIEQKRVATPTLCREMIGILKRNDDRTTIPRNIPKEVEIAHKTGGLDWVRGDAAIVYTPKPFIISIFVQSDKSNPSNPTLDIPKAEQIIGELAEICYSILK